jgi:hypothetical protein
VRAHSIQSDSAYILPDPILSYSILFYPILSDLLRLRR